MGAKPLIAPSGTPLALEISSEVSAWETCRRLADLPHLLFFDSALKSPLGRYSFVSADPAGWLRPDPGVDPFELLKKTLANWPMETLKGLPPFQGGVAGLFGYELCHFLEKLPRPRWDDFQTPAMALGIYDWVIAFDHSENRTWILSTGFPERQNRRRQAQALSRLERVKRWLEREPTAAPVFTGASAPHSGAAPSHSVPNLPEVYSNFDRDSYLHAIGRAVDYIHAGDCFQVNIAQRLMAPARLAPITVYQRLRERNPAPFAGYFDLGDHVVASASPERFLKLTGAEVETRPIKGTRPRGFGAEEDLFRADDLLISAKDRAENVMIVDLLRNDMGRVCQYGSVRVESLCRVESYRTVHHLVSEVRGTLRPGLGAVDVLRAAFPGGSVTGAPKIRAMEIITELEQVARGPYCGCLGYIGFDGSMDSNLLIRTFTIGNGWMRFPVGGGIVADSDPEREYEETWHKAEGLLRVLV